MTTPPRLLAEDQGDDAETVELAAGLIAIYVRGHRPLRRPRPELPPREELRYRAACRARTRHGYSPRRRTHHPKESS